MTQATCVNKNISPTTAHPSIQLRECGVGGNESPVQGALSGLSSLVRIRSWRCLVMEKKAGRMWVVVVSPEAVIQPAFGWVCDCSIWTFGNDSGHIPVSMEKADAEKRHDARNKRRQIKKIRMFRTGDL